MVFSLVTIYPVPYPINSAPDNSEIRKDSCSPLQSFSCVQPDLRPPPSGWWCLGERLGKWSTEMSLVLRVFTVIWVTWRSCLTCLNPSFPLANLQLLNLVRKWGMKYICYSSCLSSWITNKKPFIFSSYIKYSKNDNVYTLLWEPTL